MTFAATVWNENIHEVLEPHIMPFYPAGIHGAVADALYEQLGDAVTVHTATLDQEEHGLTESVLANTDVLFWWGHLGHDRVDDAIVERVQRQVLSGMGLVVLHSGHFSKIFTRLLGTTCSLAWRDDADREVVWTTAPGHPIAKGVPSPLVIEHHETYGEFFDVPEPEETVFISSFSGGEVFRSGLTYRRGRGRIFYFSPGDQKYPVYLHPDVRRVLGNAARWAAGDDFRRVPAVSHPALGELIETAARRR
ncbi:ThuA domain-containing protein [Diaminobutyricibacter sp. McL0618]|uniref:ThuA domain-containing protein n=1 Tax=Leifsonia sp. McL0618 TaxID=3415677 RepID=UPI003CECC417